MQTAKLCNSGGDARRALSEGGVYVNNTRVEDVQKRLTVDDLDGRSVLVLRRGKRKYALLKILD